MAPALVVPPDAATATNPSPSSSPRARARASPVIRPRPSAGTPRISASMMRAAVRIDECASAVATMRHRRRGRPRRASAHDRAAANALRLPIVPPETNTPPAVAGHPASDASHARASFSAWIAPAPASQVPAKMLAALTAPPKARAASVGAAGT
jgi:hypothetical protein